MSTVLLVGWMSIAMILQPRAIRGEHQRVSVIAIPSEWRCPGGRERL